MKKTFSSKDMSKAYKWSSLESAQKISKEFAGSEIEIIFESRLNDSFEVTEGMPPSGLELFILAYAECLLWSSIDDNDAPLDSSYCLDDFTIEAVNKIKLDCEKFFNENEGAINSTPDNYFYDNAGHDFWLTRNGHGAGFWDGDAGESGDILTEQSKKYPELNAYVTDNNLIDLE
jgi:hypothetical protein